MRDAVDLSRYFARIGYRGPAEPTLDVLRQLQLLHPQSIPFENLNPFTGARVALELESVVDKLVGQRRGGYCFEQNKL
ncbi:arylamine N-acetyltransferase family protein, partial [Burkholderia pseudomallei]